MLNNELRIEEENDTIKLITITTRKFWVFLLGLLFLFTIVMELSILIVDIIILHKPVTESLFYVISPALILIIASIVFYFLANEMTKDAYNEAIQIKRSQRAIVVDGETYNISKNNKIMIERFSERFHRKIKRIFVQNDQNQILLPNDDEIKATRIVNKISRTLHIPIEEVEFSNEIPKSVIDRDNSSEQLYTKKNGLEYEIGFKKNRGKEIKSFIIAELITIITLIILFEIMYALGLELREIYSSIVALVLISPVFYLSIYLAKPEKDVLKSIRVNPSSQQISSNFYSSSLSNNARILVSNKSNQDVPIYDAIIKERDINIFLPFSTNQNIME